LPKKNKSSGNAKSEKPEKEQKTFKAKSMVDGDVRMPKSLRQKIAWLNGHINVTFEVLELKPNSITLKISKSM